MGQHGSTESIPQSAYNPSRQRTGDANLVSEDETMVDASYASSVVSAGTRTSFQQNVNVSRILPHRTRASPTSNRGPRPARRSNLWCRVQSLRDRIYRTTRNVNMVNNLHSTSQPAISRTSPPSTSRRNTLGSPLVVSPNLNRRSGIFGSPPPRPLSYHESEPFVHNIDPRFEPSDDRRPRTSGASANTPRRRSNSHPRRSIWGSPSPSRPIPASPTPPVPTVIDHSTQTNALNHPIQPFNITRRPGEDQAEMLSRFLYVAGAALAASLVGSTDSTTSQLQDFSADFADASLDDLAEAPEGSFEGFLRALRQGRAQFAQALRSDPSNSAEDSSGSGFTYLLMYRFSSRTSTPSTTPTPDTSTSRTSSNESDIASMTEADSRPTSPQPTVRSSSSEPSEPRMVPFVIIGVQPVAPRDTPGHPVVPSFSEGVASLLANARQHAGQIRPGLRSTSSSGNLATTENPLHGSASIPSIPGAWRDSPPPVDSHRRRASVDGSFRTSNNSPSTSVRDANTRAWQMYIYGGAYPENHIIFTAPTLFTDVCTFKRLILSVESKFGRHVAPSIDSRRSQASGGIKGRNRGSRRNIQGRRGRKYSSRGRPLSRLLIRLRTWRRMSDTS